MTKSNKIFISLIPVIALSLIVISTNYYYFFDNEYKKVYEIISYTSGFSLLSLYPWFYIIRKLNFCIYSRIAVWGILGYILINISYFFLELANIKVGYYAHVFEAFGISIALIFSIIYLIKSLKNGR